MKKLFLFMTFMMVCSLSSWAQTATDNYLDIANYATMEGNYTKFSLSNIGNVQYLNLYKYEEYPDDGVAWLTMPVYLAARSAGSQNNQNLNWITVSANAIYAWSSTEDLRKWFSGTNIPIGTNPHRSATNPFWGSNEYFGTGGAYRYGNADNGEWVAFYVTNVTQIQMYLNWFKNTTSTENNGVMIEIYKCKSATDMTLEEQVVRQLFHGSSAGNTTYSSGDLLQADKIYKVVCTCKKGCVSEIAFRTPLQQPATIEVTPTSLDFDTPAGTSVTKTFTVKGTNLKGDITATLTGENNVYSINPLTITKAEAEATDGKEVTVTFLPTSAGTFNRTITLESQGATPITINLTGVARQPVIVAEPTELSFETRVGTSVTKTFHVSGTNLAEPITATLSNANGVYSLSTMSVSVEDGTAGKDISVTFNPQEFGTYNETITLSSGNAEVDITLTGKAIDGYDLVITTAGLSTLYLDYPVSIPFDTYPDLLGVFYIYGIGSNGKELLASTLDDIIPANTGVIVQGNANIPEIPTYFFPRISDEEAATYTENSVTSMLKGTTTPIGTQSVESETGKRVYTLGRARNSYINFYHYTGTTLAANKAYLLVEPSTNANAFSILFDGDATGINVVDVNNVDGAWYNLQGVKMQGEPTSKGVFIHNGKKVVVQ